MGNESVISAGAGGLGASRGLRVLVVEDGDAPRLSSALGSLGCDCKVIQGASAANEFLQRSSVDAILYATQGAELRGDLIRGHGRTESAPLVVVAQGGTVRGAVDAMKQGAADYLIDPIDPLEVRAALERAYVTSAQVRPLPSGMHETLLGEDAAMRTLMVHVDQVARSSAPVLLQGESGTGKELVARAIHKRSPRSDRAFVAINAAAIPETLLESELFGHVKGAFTGANRTRTGLLQQAHGGTLFLDEIGDMPLLLQAKLLRALQEGEVRAVGGEAVQRVDVRVITATHRDLLQMTQQGLFREDLYFRLNVIPLKLPPLRQRRDDIPLLARYFLGQARLRSPTSPVREFSPEAILLLKEAPWHGNVRELASTIERLVVLGGAETITADFVRSLRPFPPVEPPAQELPEEEKLNDSFFARLRDDPWPLKRLTASYVSWVLARTSGNKMRAAQILGINLSTLYRWIKNPLLPS